MECSRRPPLKYARRHGLHPPYHYLQVMAIFAFFLFGVAVYAVLIQSLRFKLLKWIIIGCQSFFTLGYMVCWCVISLVNPSTDRILAMHVFSEPRPSFTATPDVPKVFLISGTTFTCVICATRFLPPTAKHCRSCNKCIADFDHHCLWLNNCIGSKNYVMFINYVLMTLAACFFPFWLAIAEIALYVTNNVDCIDSTTLFGLRVRDTVWLAITVVIAAGLAVLGITVTTLFRLHASLMYHGLTTYSASIWDDIDLTLNNIETDGSLELRREYELAMRIHTSQQV